VNIDLGDATLSIRLRVNRLGYRVAWRIGAIRDTIHADREIQFPKTMSFISKKQQWLESASHNERAVLFMDLQADKKVELSAQWTDEVGNPVNAPDGVTASYDVDDPTIVNIIEEEGKVWAAATGTLGTATVHGDFTTPEGKNLTGDLTINVVTGLAERVNIVAGDPQEITPDA